MTACTCLNHPFCRTDRPTLGLGNTAGEAEGKAGRDLLFLVAAHACGAPVPERLCPNR